MVNRTLDKLYQRRYRGCSVSNKMSMSGEYLLSLFGPGNKNDLYLHLILSHFLTRYNTGTLPKELNFAVAANHR